MKLRLRPHHAPRFRTEQPTGDKRVITLPVPGFRQTRSYTCGFASALMVLRYHGIDISGIELFRRLGTGRDGTRQSALVRELRAAGLHANLRYDVDFSRIRQAIDHNKLIIGYLNDIEHWLVIYGYGLEPERIFVADPRPDEPCEHEWKEYSTKLGGFGIVCSHHAESSVRQTPLSLVEPSEPASMNGPPPSPLSQLRCEVRRAPSPEPPHEPKQLALPFTGS